MQPVQAYEPNSPLLEVSLLKRTLVTRALEKRDEEAILS
jgi:hypothetical protein